LLKAYRGIILRDSFILMSYETLTDQWMIPGGGLEEGEDERACCAGEVAEEPGLLVEPSACALEIDEYYQNRKWVNRYFFCEVTGKTAPPPFRLWNSECRMSRF
jgi:ADP-ribose pyrophosphatase